MTAPALTITESLTRALQVSFDGCAPIPLCPGSAERTLLTGSRMSPMHAAEAEAPNTIAPHAAAKPACLPASGQRADDNQETHPTEETVR